MKHLCVSILTLCILILPSYALAKKPLLFSSGAGAMSGMVDIAIAKGFIEDENAKMCVFKNGKASLNAFLNGKVDIGTTALNNIVISHDFDPKKHVIIATLSYTDSQLKLLTRNASGIKQIADLRGKKIATPGLFNDFALNKLLNKHNIALTEVTITKLPKAQMPEAIASGKVDAIFQHGKPIEESKKLLRNSGWKQFQDPNIDRKWVVLVMNRDMIANNPKLTENVLRGIHRAQTFFPKNPSEGIAITAKSKKYSIPKMKEAMGEITYDLQLRQSLLLTMEALKTWAIENSIVPPQKPCNYFEYIDPIPLKKINPNAVTLIH